MFKGSYALAKLSMVIRQNITDCTAVTAIAIWVLKHCQM